MESLNEGHQASRNDRKRFQAWVCRFFVGVLDLEFWIQVALLRWVEQFALTPIQSSSLSKKIRPLKLYPDCRGTVKSTVFVEEEHHLCIDLRELLLQLFQLFVALSLQWRSCHTHLSLVLGSTARTNTGFFVGFVERENSTT